MVINHRKLNPNAYQLLKYISDPAIRLIVMYGGSSSGKSYSVAQIILLQTLSDCENTLVLRKVAASIEKSIYEDFKVAAAQLGISKYFKFVDGTKRIKCLVTKARIDFAGLDDPEKIKGISNYMRLVLEEMSEFDLQDYKQLRLRLRGKEGQKIIGTFNPISEKHWIKTSVFDTEVWHDAPIQVEIAGEPIPLRLTEVKSVRMNEPKEIMHKRTGEVSLHPSDSVLIQSTYLNNFWVVGSPDGKYGYYDDQAIAVFEHDRLHDPDYYNVYALGEWGVIRTGSEFFSAFNRGKHCAEVEHDASLPIHLSVDNNRLPYISYSFWQISYGDTTDITQFHEICATSPDNSARKSAMLVADYLRSIAYGHPLYLHGDCTTRSGNTIDDDGRSFLDKVISTLAEQGFEVVDKVGRNNPSVAMTGEFVNSIWDGDLPGYSLTIGEECRSSIDDYQSVQKDANGAMLKTKVKDKVTGQSYEAHGHLSDTMRYAIYDLLRSEYTTFANSRKRNLYAQDGLLRFFNTDIPCAYDADIAYCMPNVAGKCVILRGRKCADKWHIVSAHLFETDSTDEIRSRLKSLGCECVHIETGKAYFPFVRELRAEGDMLVKVIAEGADIDRRISATSDYVRSSVLFNEQLAASDAEYSAFVESLLDYNKDSDSKEASAALSGFVKAALKLS